MSFFCRYYLFLWVVISTSSSFDNYLLDFLETLVILSAILLPIKSPVASAVFWTALFEAVFIASVVDFLTVSRSFWLYLLFKFLPMFLAKDKNPYPLTYVLSLGSIEYLIFICMYVIFIWLLKLNLFSLLFLMGDYFDLWTIP